MKLVEGTHYRRRLDHPHPHPSKETVDCLLCAAPSDSEDDEIRRRMQRKNTRKGFRLDELMRHFRCHHPSQSSTEGRTLLHYPGFSRATAGPETVVAVHPRSLDSDHEPMESAEPPSEVYKHEQRSRQQQQPLTSSQLPSATAEIGIDMGQPYWRTLSV
jgi:hypothetical protein